jgi:phenylacetic acid degradation operon negative regulatory protein
MLWAGALVRLMAPFGLSEQAVRQAISRMTRQGWLAPQKLGNRAFYAVTTRGRRRIEELSPRIYGPHIEWDGKWRMLTYSVREANRERRDRLRKDLTVLGWAPLSASTWISPGDALAGAREAAESNGVLGDIDLFVGTNEGLRSDRELLERCWNLPAIAEAYRGFVTNYAPRLTWERARVHDGLSDEEAFVERLWLVHDYRKFAYLDPGLPSVLLPKDWPGTSAAALFREYYETIRPKSTRFFEAATLPAHAV